MRISNHDERLSKGFRPEAMLLFLLVASNVFAQSGEIAVGGRVTTGIIVRDEGSTVAQADYMDFTGAGVTVTSDGKTYTITIGGGGGGASNSFETWSVPNGTDVVADSSTDTVTFTGTGVTITGTAGTDTIDFTVDGDIERVGDCLSGECLVTRGNITVDTVTGALTGNADTATALAADPADCGVNTFATTIAASGALTCAAIADADVPNTITIDNATTAANLGADGVDALTEIAQGIKTAANDTSPLVIGTAGSNGEIAKWNTDGTLTDSNVIIGTVTDGKWCSYASTGTLLSCTQDAPAGSGDITDVFSCASGDCASITMAATDLLNMSGVDASTATEGLILPQHATACAGGTAEGQVCWEADINILHIGDGATIVDFVPTSAFSGDATVSTTGAVTLSDSVAVSSWNLTTPTFTTSANGAYLTASEILITDGSKNIVSAAVATYPSLTELTYVKGVTSAIQTQINGKQATVTEGSLTDSVIVTADIKDGEILEADLNAIDAAGDEECLTSEGTGFEWQPCGGGADTNSVKTYVWPMAATLPLEAADSIPPITKDTGTNNDILAISFDDSTDECRTVNFIVPTDVQSGSTITFGIIWYSQTATTGNVIWDFRHTGTGTEGEDWDQALTTEASAADAVQGTVDLVTRTEWTETLANLGWAADDMISAAVCRDANAVGDTLVGDAEAITLYVEIPRA